MIEPRTFTTRHVHWNSRTGVQVDIVQLWATIPGTGVSFIVSTYPTVPT